MSLIEYVLTQDRLIQLNEVYRKLSQTMYIRFMDTASMLWFVREFIYNTDMEVDDKQYEDMLNEQSFSKNFTIEMLKSFGVKDETDFKCLVSLHLENLSKDTNLYDLATNFCQQRSWDFKFN